MKPIEFDQMTGIAAEHQPQFENLPMYRDNKQIISCWQLSEDELKTIQETEVIWMRLFQSGRGNYITPSLLEVDSPWKWKKEEEPKEKTDKPPIVCLCGSTRFYHEFVLANFQKTMAGEIVLTVGFYPHATSEQWANQVHGEDVGITTGQKEQLDELHKRKIDLCDYIYVLNKNDYIGDSTRSEIEYAMKVGKPIIYLEPYEDGT